MVSDNVIQMTRSMTWLNLVNNVIYSEFYVNYLHNQITDSIFPSRQNN